MHPCCALLLLWTLLPAQGLSSAALSVTSIDGSIVVSIDKERGLIEQIKTHNVSIPVSAGTYIQGMITLEVLVTANESKGIIVSRLVCFPGHDVPCSTTQILIEEVFVPRTSSIGWSINASSPVWKDSPVQLFTAPLVTNVTFMEAGDKRFWAPWERGNNRDSLLPSDGGYSWWTGEYILGAEVVKHSDLVIHEMATILQPSLDVGVSFIPNPGNPPAHPTWLNLSGSGGAGCATPTSCKGPASFSISRHHLRFGDGATPHVFDTDIVAHAACWRAALGWSARTHAAYWEPVSPRMKAIEGLGSYSSNLDNIDPKLKRMGYTLNWDLSGRFFPYAAQFLPPVQPTEQWLNDAEGTQTRANVSFESIDEYYGRIQAQGFHTLSYFNVFEFGQNVCGSADWNHHTLPQCVPSHVVPSSTDW